MEYPGCIKKLLVLYSHTCIQTWIYISHNNSSTSVFAIYYAVTNDLKNSHHSQNFLLLYYFILLFFLYCLHSLFGNYGTEAKSILNEPYTLMQANTNELEPKSFLKNYRYLLFATATVCDSARMKHRHMGVMVNFGLFLTCEK